MKYLFQLCAFILLFSSCASYKIAQEGVKMDKVDQYFNNREVIQVWLYLEYDQDVVRQGGVRVDKLYKNDKKVLKSINLSSKGSRILFSVKSTHTPAHHLVAVKHRKIRIDTALYTHKYYNDSYYYQKDFHQEDIDIRQAIIPYGKRYALSLVSYTDKENNAQRPFHKLDYLANINAYYLQHPDQRQPYWQVSECPEAKQVECLLSLDKNILNKKKLSCISLFAYHDIDPDIVYFKVLSPKERELSLKLCPAKYVIKYQTIRGDLLKTDTLIVDRQ